MNKNCVWCTKLITEGRNYRILPDTNKKVPCIFHVRRFGHSDSCHNCQAKIDSSETVKVIRRNFEPKNPCKCAKAHKAKANSQDCSTCLKQIVQRGHLTAQIFGVCSCTEPVFKGLNCTNCLGKKPRDCNYFCPVKEIPEEDYCFYCYQTIHPDRDLKQTKDFCICTRPYKEKKVDNWCGERRKFFERHLIKAIPVKAPQPSRTGIEYLVIAPTDSATAMTIVATGLIDATTAVSTTTTTAASVSTDTFSIAAATMMSLAIEPTTITSTTTVAPTTTSTLLPITTTMTPIDPTTTSPRCCCDCHPLRCNFCFFCRSFFFLSFFRFLSFQ